MLWLMDCMWVSFSNPADSCFRELKSGLSSLPLKGGLTGMLCSPDPDLVSFNEIDPFN